MRIGLLIGLVAAAGSIRCSMRGIVGAVGWGFDASIDRVNSYGALGLTVVPRRLRVP